jgi:Zn-dependent protease
VDIENGLSDFPFQELIGIVQGGFLIKSFTEKEKTIYLNVLPKYSHTKSFEIIMKGLEETEYIPHYHRKSSNYQLVITKKVWNKRELRQVVHIGLILVTFLTMTGSGYIFWAPGDLFLSILFALSLMIILGVHELGHAMMARKRGIRATLPFFIPVPPPFPFGTFGAVIFINSPIPDRKSLIEVGASGPLIGFIITLPIALVGLSLSEIALITEPKVGDILFSMPLILQILATLTLGEIPSDSIIIPHPLAMAGWAGIFVTSLNLLPMGQLDGGHIIRGLFPRHFRKVYFGVAGLLLVMGVFWPGYILWVVLAFLISKMKHPGPLNDVSELDSKRKLYAISCLLVLILCFMPAPIVPS